MLYKNNDQYFRWISDLKQKIQQSQIKAAIQVNSALIEMYWDLGKEISERSFENTYGSGFFKQLSNDLKNEFPEIKGFSESNIKFFKRFYLFYNQEITNRQQLANDFKSDDTSTFQQVGGEFKNKENQNRYQLGNEFPNKLFLIAWRHHVEIFTKCKNVTEALFYINKRYVVIELKSGEFEPEYAGKLNFYVTSVDKQLRDENDNATVGLIICKKKDDIIAEYSLTDLHKPLGISSYELRKILPYNFKSSLPSIEEIENELNKNINTK